MENYDFNDEDLDLLVDSLWNGTIVQKDGKYGAMDPQGKEVLPCVFDQIEKLLESVFGRLNDSYWEFRIHGGSQTIRAGYSDTGFFVENGKKGWQVDGKAVVPDTCAFHFRKLKWLLENGADINAHHHNLTALDFLVGNDKNFLLDEFSAKDKAYNEQMRAKVTTFLIEHGAKTMQQIKEEEAKNEDYRIELQRMG